MVKKTKEGKQRKGFYFKTRESRKTSNKQMRKSALTLKFRRKLFESQLGTYRSIQLQQELQVEFPKEADCKIGNLSGGALGMNTQKKGVNGRD